MLPVTETLITQRSVVQIRPHSRIVGEYSVYTDQAIDQGYRAVQELLIERTLKIRRDASSNDCSNSVLDFTFGTVPTNSNRVCGVPQPSAFQKLERHLLEFSGDIGSYSFLPRFWRAPDLGLTVAQIVAQERAYAAQ
jgi:hypothetical protein